LDLAGALGLLHNQRAIDFLGDADAAGLREGFRILFDLHRAPDAGTDGIAERAFAIPSKFCAWVWALAFTCDDTLLSAAAKS
jgi:hypothetical protein